MEAKWLKVMLCCCMSDDVAERCPPLEKQHGDDGSNHLVDGCDKRRGVAQHQLQDIAEP